MRFFVLLSVALSVIACSPAAAVTDQTAGDAAGSDTTADASTQTADKRNSRYCEILLGTFGTDTVHVDVYSTEGLNACPETAWQAMDVDALKTATGADLVLLNGPRYWMLDSLAGSVLQDTAVQTFGTIDMRKAGQIDLPLKDLTAMSKPYTHHTIHRQTAFHWLAGQAVFELHDADGHAYAMQSYSAQKQPLTVTDLPGLAQKLTGLPTGWSFAPRTLQQNLDVLATAGDATVVQDELGNTYSME